MPAPKDFGDAMGRFGTWAGDLFLGQKQKSVAPSYQVDFGQMDEDRANQMALYQQLSQMAAGNGPSLAQGQLQQATDQNINQSMALGAAQQGQGMGYASALRGIADQSAQARQQAAAQSAMIRNAEQMQGMQGMGALAGQMSSQDFARQQLGSQNAMGYDTMNANIAAQNAKPGGILGAVINAGGGILSHAMGMGGGGLQQQGGGGYGVPDISEPTPMSDGGKVPGYAMGGELDSEDNDTVPSMLSPGEIVLPRSVTMAPDAAERAKLFVQAVQQRQKAGPPKYEHHLAAAARRKAA